MLQPGPRVVALLVTHDGAVLLPRALGALAAQTYPHLEVLAVDNASTDGTAQRLIELLGPDRVLFSDIDLGFSSGIDLALDALSARDLRDGIDRADDLLLMLHDDLLLQPDAVSELVAALIADPTVAIVGPKLRWLDDPHLLQSVGATIDLTGRVDDGIDPGELDQGQRDEERRVLFVHTAGMVVRRRVFDELGRFDPRSHAFREDLDLCWRAAIAGHDVEVVPAAVALHGARAAEHERRGRVAELGPRFLAERNTLAALLKNYGPERLAVVLPIALAVGAAKVVGFLVARRVADARDTLAAWWWNIIHLPGTLRLRRGVQRARRRRDAEIAPLFGRVTPRLRAYLEAFADRLAGDAPLPGEQFPTGVIAPPVPPEVLDVPGEQGGRVARFRATLAAAPVRIVAPPVLVALVVGLRAILVPGPFRGGALAPFPAGPGLVSRYGQAWHDSGATLTALDPSPAHLLLGLLQLVMPGQGGLALRALLVVPILVAWGLAYRLLQRFVGPRALRFLLATLYAVSPPALVAVGSGDIVTLIVLATLPGVVLLGATPVAADAPVARVWRHLAGVVVLIAVTVSFLPVAGVLLPLIVLASLGHALVVIPPGRWRWTFVARMTLVATLPLVLLGTWASSLPAQIGAALRSEGLSIGGHPATWLALDPTGHVLGVAGVGLVVAAALGALLLVATSVRSVVVLGGLGFLLPLVAWAMDRAGLGVPAGPLLIVAAGALVALAGAGLDRAPAALSRYPFGWRQLTVASVAGLAVLAGAVGLGVHAVVGTPGIQRTEAVPPFIASLGSIPPERVLLLGDTTAGTAWEVVPATGPDLRSFGVRHDPETFALITTAVDDLLAGTDPRAAARLGRLGIGAIVVLEGFESDALREVLRTQVDLDPLPTVTGLVTRIIGAVPGAAIASDSRSAAWVPDPATPPRRILQPLPADGPGRFAGPSGPGGEVLLTVPLTLDWTVRVDGRVRAPLLDDDLIRVIDVPADVEVEASGPGAPRRRTALWFQALAFLTIVSLGVRPPAVALRAERDRRALDTTAIPLGEVTT